MAEKNSENKDPKPIFAKPFGASEGKHSFCHSATSGQILCQLCGTVWPEPPSDYSRPWGTFLGRQFVEECCGKFIEMIYEQFGDSFAEAFLEDYSENPMDARFGFLRFILPDILAKANLKTEKVLAEISSAQEHLKKGKENSAG